MTKAIRVSQAIGLGIALAVLAAGCAEAICCAAGGHPPYLVLQPTQALGPHQGAHGRTYQGQVIPLEAPAYAYGWFGAQPRRQWSRHFGYYRNYTEWSWK